MSFTLKQTIKSTAASTACALFPLLACAVFNIRSANAATGDVSSFAGMGRNYGDGGPALGAAINHPFGLALAPDGTIFIADTYNLKIRKVDPSGNIQTIASGFFAYKLVYAGGYVYMDGGRVPAGGGGLADANISMSLMASDGASLYQIRGNSLVKVTNGVSGSATTLASFTPDTWRHLDYYNGKLYAFGNNRTICYDPELASSTNLPVIPFGALINIRGMAFDGTYLYVSESIEYPYAPADPANNIHRIRRVTLATGLVENFLGGQQGDIDGTGLGAAFSFPRELVLGPDGKLYIADLFNHKIKRANTTTSEVVTIAGAGLGTVGLDRLSATIKSPLNLDGDKDGNIYIAELGGQRILKVSPQGNISVLAGSGLAGDVDGTGPNAQFRYPCHVTVQGDFLYVADFGTHKIRRVHIASGQVTTLAGKGVAGVAADGPLSDAKFSFPWGIFSRDGRIYVADTGNHVIREIDLALNRVRTLAGRPGIAGYANGVGAQARFNQPRGLSVDNENIYIADSVNHLIRKLNLKTLEVTTIAGSIPQSGYVDSSDPTMVRFTQPWGVSWGDTKIYVADTGNNRLRQIDKDTGQTTTLAGSGLWGDVDGSGPGAKFKYPHGLYCKPEAGILFVADTHNHKIRAVKIPSSTPPMPPVSPSDLQAVAIEGLKIILTWAPSPSQGVVRQNVYMAKSGQAFDFFSPAAVLGPEKREWTAEKLEESVTYRFIVRAENQFLEEKNTNEVTATAFTTRTCPIATIKVPNNGMKVSGNSLTVMAEVGKEKPSDPDISKVLFEYRTILQPDFSTIPASNANHPNPDTAFPYFTHWDVSSLANGEYFIRAQSFCGDSPSNGAPHITIYVEHSQPEVTENQDKGKQQKQEKVASHKDNDVTVSDAASEYIADVHIRAGAIDNEEDGLSLELESLGGGLAVRSEAKMTMLAELDIALVSGQKQLKSPADISISYDGGINPELLSLAYFNPAAGKWELIPSRIDEDNMTVSAVTSHFSKFGLVYVIRPASLEFDEIYAFPNPARGSQKPKIHVKTGIADIINIRIYDVAGSLVHKAQMPGPDVDYIWEGYIPSGVYIYVVEAGKQGSGTIKKVSKLAVIR